MFFPLKKSTEANKTYSVHHSPTSRSDDLDMQCREEFCLCNGKSPDEERAWPTFFSKYFIAFGKFAPTSLSMRLPSVVGIRWSALADGTAHPICLPAMHADFAAVQHGRTVGTTALGTTSLLVMQIAVGTQSDGGGGVMDGMGCGGCNGLVVGKYCRKIPTSGNSQLSTAHRTATHGHPRCQCPAPGWCHSRTGTQSSQSIGPVAVQTRSGAGNPHVMDTRRLAQWQCSADRRRDSTGRARAGDFRNSFGK